MFTNYKSIVSRFIKTNQIFCLLFSIAVLNTSPLQAQTFDSIKSPALNKKLILPNKNSLKYKLDRNYRVLQDLPNTILDNILPLDPPASFPLPTPPRSNYKTWVGINVFNRREPEHGGRPTLLKDDLTTIHILNPGLTTASVSCTTFSSNGTLLLDSTGNREINPGAKGFCGITKDSDGWIVISANQAILVDGYHERRITRETSASLTLYPIDCSDPEGFEFICQFVNN